MKEIDNKIEVAWQEIIDAQRKLDWLKNKYIELLKTKEKTKKEVG